MNNGQLLCNSGLFLFYPLGLCILLLGKIHNQEFFRRIPVCNIPILNNPIFCIPKESARLQLYEHKQAYQIRQRQILLNCRLELRNRFVYRQVHHCNSIEDLQKKNTRLCKNCYHKEQFLYIDYSQN